jgi:hypothetical protein
VHLRKRRLVDLAVLTDELVGGEQVGGQRIDLLVAQALLRRRFRLWALRL